MSTEIPNSDKTQLLFKEFTGVSNVKQPEPFPSENFAFRDYIFSNRVFSEDIPSSLPLQYRAANLDLCGNISNGSSIDFDGTGSYPDLKLRFHKKVQLQPAESGSLKSWYLPDGNGGSSLQNSIPFKYDPVNSSYVQKCYRKLSSTTYFQIQMYSSPLFWLFDYKSGFLLFFGDETTLGNFFTASNGPCFSFFQYIGKTGAGSGGGGGDASGNLDLSGNLTVIGDASFCNVLVRCDLDVSGNTDMSGNLTVVKDATFNDNINVTNDAIVRNTNLIQTFEGIFDPVILPPNTTKVFRLAYVPKTTAISSGYFTIQVSTPDYLQTINFIAGIIENKTPFIKILSNINQNFLEGIEDISIGQDTITIGGDPNYYLTFRFKVQQGNSRPVDYMKITLVNNHNNYDANLFQGMNWKLLDQPNETPAGFTYTYLASAELDLNGGNAYGLSTQREYFQNDIVMGPSGNIVANDGTGTIDICGNLFVDLDASFNRSVYIRDTIDVSNNANIENNLTVSGNLDVTGRIRGRDTLKIDNDVAIGGSLTVNGVVTTVGNTTLVEYKHYDNGDFTTTTTLQWHTIAVSEHESGTSDRASYAEFYLYDNTTNADSTILVFSVSKLTTNNVTINVKEINWNTSSQCIEKIRVKFGSVISNRRAEIQIYHKRISNSTNPTSIDIRMYSNLSKTASINDILPWKLSSDNQTYSHNITELDLTNNNNNNNSSATNIYKYFDKGIMLGHDINLNSKDINNTNQLKGSITSNNINFNNSGNLRLNALNTLAFGTNGSTNDIEFSNSNLDFNGSNKIENLSYINNNGGDITIGNQNNNVLLDASQVEIRSKGGGPPFGDIILNNNGGGNGSIIFKNGAPTKGDIRFNASNLIGFDLSNNKLRVDEMESSTTNEITIQSDLDLNSNDIQNLANLNITGTNLTIGTLNNRVNFKSMTNMFVDSTSNVSSKLTTVGDLAICNSPVSQKGIVFANSNSLNTVIKKFQVSTGTAIYYSFNDMDQDVTLGLNGGSGPGNTSYIYYYNSKFLGSANTNNINGPSWSGSGSTANPIIAAGSTSGYTLPFWGSLDALLINGFENSLIAGHTATGQLKNYKFRLSIGVWAGTSYNAPGVRFIGEYDIDTSVLPNGTLLNLTDAVFTRDQTMIKSGINLQPSGLPTSPNTPTNWFNSNNEPINWGIISGSTSNIQRIGVVIKLENTSSAPGFPQTIKWEKPTMGVQTFLKMDVPWNIP